MAELVIRPTMKFIYFGYAIVLLIVVALVVVSMRIQWPESIPVEWQPWIPWFSLLLLLWPAKRHIRNRLTRMTILDDKLRYETGLLNKTTRTILISRVQDLTVHQRIGQRIFGVGDLSIETAGETSRLTIPEIDQPQRIADHINELSQKGPAKEPPAKEPIS
jgi:putative membrane protein